MTPDQKQLVRESWKQVVPTAEAAAELFYRRLFEIDPTTPELFRATDMFAQRTKLLQTLGFPSAAGQSRPADGDGGKPRPPPRRLWRHRGALRFRGLRAVVALEQRLGHAWTPAVASAWGEIYALLSGVMRTAAKDIGPQGMRP